MAEIKSAIELAMERTKHLIMEKEEKEVFAAQEVESRLKALLRRYMEDMIDKEKVAEEYALIKGDESHKKSVVISFFMEQFNFRENDKKLINLFDIAKIDLPHAIRDEIETIQKKFQEEMEKRREVMSERVASRLKTMGIEGDGITPNLEAWSDWEKEVKALEEVFRGQLGKWKDVLEGKTNRKVPD